jgi:hypothetical protein
MVKMKVPEDVRLTIESGVLCCSFSEFHEWAEKLLGCPVWTHEFALPDTAERLKLALIANDEGHQLHIKHRRSPLDTLAEMVPNKPIIVLQKS